MEDKKIFFNHKAATWDDDLKYEEKRSRLIEVVGWFELSKGDNVLDVGTGTGVLLPIIKEVIGPFGNLFAMDFSFGMLSQAKLRPHVYPNVLVNASVNEIPFRSNQFDRVTCFSAFPHFPDKKIALLEMVRVLKKGGKIFIAHIHSIEELNQLHKKIGGPVSQDFLPSQEEFYKLLSGSGLYEISIINEPGKFLAQGRKL